MRKLTMSAFCQSVATLLLPAIVFGYAGYSNVHLLLKDSATAQAAPIEAVSISGMLDGEVTKDWDSLYKQQLPHRDVSVGLAGSARYKVFGTGRKGVVVGTDNWLFTNEEFKHVEIPEITKAVEHISAVKQRLDSMGIALIILPLPAKSDILGEYVPAPLKSDAMASAYTAFMSGLAQAGIQLVDSKKEFVAQNDLEKLFLKSDTHWTPIGARFAAIATRNAVNKLGLDLEPGQVTVSPQNSISIWGDLTKFITLPDYATGLGFKPEIVELFRTQIKASDNSVDVFGEQSSAPVMLVGTSYSANENWSFEDHLRQFLSVDVVNVAKEGIGPGVPMLDLLESDSLAEVKPRLIIWEFPVRYLGSKNLWHRNSDSAADISGESHV
jgi:alginate O-acetyltransferase complex protein AlgJ